MVTSVRFFLLDLEFIFACKSSLPRDFIARVLFLDGVWKSYSTLMIPYNSWTHVFSIVWKSVMPAVVGNPSYMLTPSIIISGLQGTNSKEYFVKVFVYYVFLGLEGG
jgi:hypothetical protein